MIACLPTSAVSFLRLRGIASSTSSAQGNSQKRSTCRNQTRAALHCWRSAGIPVCFTLNSTRGVMHTRIAEVRRLYQS
jgi:hypothetical protein